MTRIMNIVNSRSQRIRYQQSHDLSILLRARVDGGGFVACRDGVAADADENEAEKWYNVSHGRQGTPGLRGCA